MRNDHKKGDKIGKLYGIGVGPGDPKLLTLKAKEVLEQVDTIFVPKGNEEGTSLARSIVEAATSRRKDFRELTFPMTKDKNVLKRHWQGAAKRIAQEINKGRKVAFVTLGDPLIYSTYIYLLKTLRQDFPKIDLETIPGISAFNAAASRVQVPLVKADEKMAILPVPKDLKGLRKAFKEFDTVVLMKVGSKLDKVVGLLEELRLIKDAVLISHVGHPDETILRNLSSLKEDKRLGYLSVIIVKNKKAKSK